MENFVEEETAIICRDDIGNIIVDDNGYVSCISEGIKHNCLKSDSTNTILALNKT